MKFGEKIRLNERLSLLSLIDKVTLMGVYEIWQITWGQPIKVITGTGERCYDTCTKEHWTQNVEITTKMDVDISTSLEYRSVFEEDISGGIPDA